MERRQDAPNERKRELADGMIDERATPPQRAAIVDVLEAFPVEFLLIASFAQGKIRPLREAEMYADASPILRGLEIGVDQWPIPPAGLFVVAENTMYLRSTSEMTIAHEFGHLLDCALGSGAYLSGVDQTIRREFEGATAFLTPYASSGLDEFFAECTRGFVGINSRESMWPAVTPERLQALAPGMSAFFDSTILDLREKFAEFARDQSDVGLAADEPASVSTAQTVAAVEPQPATARSTNARTPKVAAEPRVPKPAAKDVYRQTITDKVIAAMENGTAPWQKGWSGGEVGAPYNDTSHKLYRGGNIMRLMLENRSDPRWMTINQATEKGYELRKGEAKNGVWVEYWDHKNSGPPGKKDTPSKPPEPGLGGDGQGIIADGDSQNDPESVTPEPAKPATFHRMRVFYSTVYNAEQFDGVPPLPPPKEQAWEAVGVWETVKNLLTNAGIDIRHDGGDRAYYRPSEPNLIHLPEPRCFDSEAELAATALHEGVHWTSDSTRIDRVSNERGFFGTPAYARGELVAEMGAAIIAATMGLPRTEDNHVAYVAGWIKVLQNDKNALFQAATAAQEAADFIFDRALEKTQELAEEQVLTQAFADELISSEDLAIGIAINSLPIFTPNETDTVHVRERQVVGGDQTIKIAGRSPDGERVFGHAGGSILSVGRESFLTPPHKGKTMNVHRVGEQDVVEGLEREVALER